MKKRVGKVGNNLAPRIGKGVGEASNSLAPPPKSAKESVRLSGGVASKQSTSRLGNTTVELLLSR